MFERTDPKTLMKWLIVAALIYVLLPYDLLPDFLGIIGRLDDVLMLAWLAWYYRDHLRKYVANGFENEAAGRSKNSGQGTLPPSDRRKTFDAYEVLGITPSASNDAIRAAYRERMQEYHPDKVAHLGEDLQNLAHEKSQQIQRAYRQLSE